MIIKTTISCSSSRLYSLANKHWISALKYVLPLPLTASSDKDWSALAAVFQRQTESALLCRAQCLSAFILSASVTDNTRLSPKVTGTKSTMIHKGLGHSFWLNLVILSHTRIKDLTDNGQLSCQNSSLNILDTKTYS